MTDFTTAQVLEVAGVAARLGRNMTPEGVQRWLRDGVRTEGDRRASPLELVQTGEIAIVHQAVDRENNHH